MPPAGRGPRGEQSCGRRTLRETRDARQPSPAERLRSNGFRLRGRPRPFPNRPPAPPPSGTAAGRRHPGIGRASGGRAGDAGAARPGIRAPESRLRRAPGAQGRRGDAPRRRAGVPSRRPGAVRGAIPPAPGPWGAVFSRPSSVPPRGGDRSGRDAGAAAEVSGSASDRFTPVSETAGYAGGRPECPAAGRERRRSGTRRRRDRCGRRRGAGGGRWRAVHRPRPSRAGRARWPGHLLPGGRPACRGGVGGGGREGPRRPQWMTTYPAEPPATGAEAGARRAGAGRRRRERGGRAGGTAAPIRAGATGQGIRRPRRRRGRCRRRRGRPSGRRAPRTPR